MCECCVQLYAMKCEGCCACVCALDAYLWVCINVLLWVWRTFWCTRAQRVYTRYLQGAGVHLVHTAKKQLAAAGRAQCALQAFESHGGRPQARGACVHLVRTAKLQQATGWMEDCAEGVCVLVCVLCMLH